MYVRTCLSHLCNACAHTAVFMYIQVYGHSPLHTACLYEQQQIMQELLKKVDPKSDFINQKDKVQM